LPAKILMQAGAYATKHESLSLSSLTTKDTSL